MLIRTISFVWDLLFVDKKCEKNESHHSVTKKLSPFAHFSLIALSFAQCKFSHFSLIIERPEFNWLNLSLTGYTIFGQLKKMVRMEFSYKQLWYLIGQDHLFNRSW